MNTPYDDMPNEGAIAASRQLTEAYLYCLLQIGKDERAVLRTKLLWEEGLFCTDCKKNELTTREQVRTRQCKKCAHAQFLREKKERK